MVEQYDEWAAARTPALLRLGHALTGDEKRAEDAVRHALARTRDEWPRVVRGDPDLEVPISLARRRQDRLETRRSGCLDLVAQLDEPAVRGTDLP